MYSVALTDVGRKRLVNQDTVYISDTPVGVLPNLYIVADGMGGEKAGDYASKSLIGYMLTYIEHTIKMPVGNTRSHRICKCKSVCGGKQKSESFRNGNNRCGGKHYR